MCGIQDVFFSAVCLSCRLEGEECRKTESLLWEICPNFSSVVRLSAVNLLISVPDDDMLI